MTEQPDNIVLELLRSIRAEQAEASLKFEALAGSMVSMRKDINAMDKRIEDLTGAVNTMRADIRMIAIAVDGHSHRLDKIEAHLAIAH